MIKFGFTLLISLLLITFTVESNAAELNNTVPTVQPASTTAQIPFVAKDDYLKGLILIETVLFLLFLYRWYGNKRLKSSYKHQLKENIKNLREERVAVYVSNDYDKRRYRLKSEPLPAAGYSNMIKKAKKLELSTGEIQLASRMRKLAKKYK